MALTPEEEKLAIEKNMKQLKVSYDMYEKTKKETETRMKNKMNPDGTKKYSQADIDKELKTITTAQDDIVEQYVSYGGKEEDIKKKTRKKTNVTSDNLSKVALEIMQENEDTKKVLKEAKAQVEERLDQEYITKKDSYDAGANFDIINIPSNGEGYKDKIRKVSVSYLTAYDENMIVAPNLYRDNLILDYILDKKLLSKEIDPMDLLEGDRDAIILFLRMNGYGNDYPITATDDVTGKEFSTTVDLSKLKVKEFKLKGDSNGWFPFTLPESGAEIKFRFPTHRDTLILEKLRIAEDGKLKKSAIMRYVESLDAFIEGDKEVSNDEKIEIRQAIRTLERWADKIDDEELKFNRSLTNRLNLLVMAVNGITDRNYVLDFIKKMRVKDSSALRKYMSENEPGIDYEIEVERPKSLGGVSFKTFLQLDQFLFLNLPE
jgi:hypothetical protein